MRRLIVIAVVVLVILLVAWLMTAGRLYFIRWVIHSGLPEWVQIWMIGWLS